MASKILQKYPIATIVAITTILVLIILYLFACEKPKASQDFINGVTPDTLNGRAAMYQKPAWVLDWEWKAQTQLAERRAKAPSILFTPQPAPLGKPSPSLPNLGIYHGSDPSIGAATGTDIAVFKVFGDSKIHIEANCTAQNTGTGTFWIADTDTYHQYHFFILASYNITTGFMGDYYKDDYFPRSYCVSDLPCGVCSPSPGDHYNYICPGQVDTYYDEYPADTLGDYAFKITVNELGRIAESDQPDKDNAYIFGGHVVVDSVNAGCSPDGVCYKFVRDDNVVTPRVRQKLLNMK